MKVYYLDDKAAESHELDFSDHPDADDEAIREVADLLHNNQKIHTLTIDHCELREQGVRTLRHAVLGHKSLRNLCLTQLRMGSYPCSTYDEYYFPESLDYAVDQLCAILRDARLNFIEITDLKFLDHTIRKYEHIDMVDPVSMRDILTQEKEPYYFKEIMDSLKANFHLHRVHLTAMDRDMSGDERALQINIRRQHQSEDVNEILQGTHAAAESHLMPEIYKFLALHAWVKRWSDKRKR